MTPEQRLQFLSAAWTSVAEAYDTQMTPRFQPWAQETVRRLQAEGVTPGTAIDKRIYAPLCGPGFELILLAQCFPNCKIVGGDIAPGMIKLCRENAEKAALSEQISAEVVECSSVPNHLQPLAGIFSCFGLMLLPQVKQSLANWTAALAPGGVAAICIWPSPERQKDWLMRQAILCSIMVMMSMQGKSWHEDWEPTLTEPACKQGAVVISDEEVTHPMHFDSPDHFWEVFTATIGPLQYLLKSGRPEIGEKVKEAREHFLQKARAGSGSAASGPIVLHPNARIMVLKKT